MKIYHKPFTDKVNRYLLIGRSRAIMLFSILLLSSNACFQTEKTLQTKALESKSTITRELELEAQEREVKQSEEFEREKREREREVKEGLEQLKREREAKEKLEQLKREREAKEKLEQLKREREAKEKLEQLKRENARAREENARAREERARAREERARAREMQDLRNAMDRILEELINLYLESEDEEITQDQIVEKEKYADEGTVIRIENPIDKECQICCEEFSNTTPRYCFSCCMREDNLKNIDGDCIKRIIDNKPYCPFCRKKLNKEKIRSLLK